MRAGILVAALALAGACTVDVHLDPNANPIPVDAGPIPDGGRDGGDAGSDAAASSDGDVAGAPDAGE